MSLFGALSKKAGGIDDALDAIFQSSAGPSTSLTSKTSNVTSAKESSKKKRRGSEARESDKLKKKVRVDLTSTASERSKKSGVKKASSKADKSKPEPVTSGGDSGKEKDDSEGKGTAGEDESDSDSSQIPVHETLTKKVKKTSKARKFVPEDETPEQRNARTIFVGNLPAEIVKSKSLTKRLKRHIKELVPNSDVESIRFRSVPFQNPTAKLDAEDKKPQKKKEDLSERDNREQKRTSEWREKQKRKGGDDEEGKADEKKYMSPAQKRRLAFIKGEVHDDAARVNAYVVFAHPIPSDMWPSNLPPKEVMDPVEAAKAAVAACNGSSFEGHTLHVDFVAKLEKGTDEGDSSAVQADPKLSVYVGNLDFGAAEDDLRAFFEATLCTERGSAPEAKEDADQSESRTWVTNVRIVRDRETQVGKGFAYVQLLDRECVDEILALEPAKLKFAKRPLRVQRCKTMPGTQVKISSAKASSRASKVGEKGKGKPTEKKPRAVTSPVAIPKGDPKLGEKLAGLSKEARKTEKAKDADRIARRLAKKKAKNALEKAGVKARDDLKGRARERKKGGASINIGKKTGKPRVRSERATNLKNTKKQ